eukprot:TRINITY_DN12426_c0_g1_i3.p1 TRINITY_DN12426_c0_g1~~TRINITY_DN12426_c0_g1_i3.p1  ORF type:complete len:205 (-),score=36.53 TRINITY_DN12426_c0_g1_i3:58-651(-)
MIRRPPRSTHCISSAASDVYKRQIIYKDDVDFFIPLICLIILIYSCKKLSLVLSKVTSSIYDLEHTDNIDRDGIEIAQRKFNLAYWLRVHTFLLMTLLIGGFIMDKLLFSRYSWITDIYDQGSKTLYFWTLLYLFRPTARNALICEDIPEVHPDMRVLQEIVEQEMTQLEKLRLVIMPGDCGCVRLVVRVDRSGERS